MKATLMAGVIFGGLVLFSGKIEQISTFSNKNEKRFQSIHALTSSLNYASYILSKKMCVDRGTSLPKPGCDPFTDNGSLERLIILPSTISDLNNRFGVTVNPLKKMELNINIHRLSESHPLFDVLKEARAKKLVINYKSKQESSKGKMVSVQIDVALEFEEEKENLKGTRVLNLGKSSVNQYSLVLNRNLAIGVEGANHAKSEIDNGRRTNIFASNNEGLMSFKSPVLINGEIYSPGHKSKAQVKGINFESRLDVTKEPMFYHPGGASMAKPAQVGELNYLSDNNAFKGFKGGIKLVRYEEALESIFSESYDGPVRSEKMMRCIAYNRRRNDLAATKLSRLLVKAKTTDTFIIGLSKENEFVRVLPSDNSWRSSPKPSINIEYPSGDKKPILSITTRINGSDTSIPLAPDYKVEINTLDAGLVDIKLTASDQAKYNQTYTDFGAENAILLTKLADDKAQLLVDYPGNSNKSLREDKEDDLDDEYNKDYAKLQKKYQDKRDDIMRPYQEDVPKIKISLARGIGPSQSGDLKIQFVDTSPKHEWKNDIAFKFKVFNLRTPTFANTSYKYLNFNQDIDKGLRRDGPNRRNMFNPSGSGMISAEFEKVLTYKVNPSDKSVLINPLYSANSEWSRLPDFDNIDMTTLSAEEAESLSVDAVDWEEECKDFKMEDASSLSEAIAFDFIDQAFISWNYNPVSMTYQFDPTKVGDAGYKGSSWSEVSADGKDKFVLNSLYINNTNQKTFHIYSVVDKCIVEESADYVMGFLVCRQLFINDRLKPLQMVGTFVADHIEVAPSAIANTITWGNIYEQSSIKLFRTLGLLPSEAYCKIDPNNPAWNPNPTQSEMDKMKRCSAYSISRLSDPFNWNSFNPSCGLADSNSIVTTCKPQDRVDTYFMSILGDKYEY